MVRADRMDGIDGEETHPVSKAANLRKREIIVNDHSRIDRFEVGPLNGSKASSELLISETIEYH